MHRTGSIQRCQLEWRAICLSAGIALLIVCVEQCAAEVVDAQSRSAALLNWAADGAPRWIASPQVPLSGSVMATTSLPAVVTVEVREGDHSWQIPVDKTPRAAHAIEVLGLKPGRSYELVVAAHSASEKLIAEPLAIATPELPSDFPEFTLVTSVPERMEPGLTLCTVLRWEDNAASLDVGWFIAFDASGEVVWYYRLPEPGGSIRRREEGGFGFLHGARPTGYREIDALGYPQRQFRAVQLGVPAGPGEIPVKVDTFHHDVTYLPNGSRLLLSTEVRTVRGFPTNPLRPGQTESASVVGDVVLELGSDGAVVGRWPLLDILDPTRIGYGSLDRFWDLRAYPFHFGGTRDWSHCNSVAFDERDDALLVCLRHQDAVVKFDRKTSEVRWILGDRSGWKGDLAEKVLRPEGRVQMPYHAHGVKFRPEDGAVLLFDNGNCRAMPPGRPQPAATSYSRAVEYRVDEENGTLREAWSYGGPGRNRFFSAFVGDADWLPQTGNVLITDGGRLQDRNGTAVGEPPGAAQWGRVLEVTRDKPAEIVFELRATEIGRNNGFGSSIYRAERILSLYR